MVDHIWSWRFISYAVQSKYTCIWEKSSQNVLCNLPTNPGHVLRELCLIYSFERKLSKTCHWYESWKIWSKPKTLIPKGDLQIHTNQKVLVGTVSAYLFSPSCFRNYLLRASSTIARDDHLILYNHSCTAILMFAKVIVISLGHFYAREEPST